MGLVWCFFFFSKLIFLDPMVLFTCWVFLTAHFSISSINFYLHSSNSHSTVTSRVKNNQMTPFEQTLSVTVRRKISLLRGRNFRQNQAQGRVTICCDWLGKEKSKFILSFKHYTM